MMKELFIHVLLEGDRPQPLGNGSVRDTRGAFALIYTMVSFMLLGCTWPFCQEMVGDAMICHDMPKLPK